MEDISRNLRELAKSGEFGAGLMGIRLSVTLKALDSATRYCLQRFINFGFKRISDEPDIVYELFDKDFGLWALSLLLDAPTPDAPDTSMVGYIGNLRFRELNKSETGVIVEIPREFPQELYSLGKETVKDFGIRQTKSRTTMLKFYLAALSNDTIFQLPAGHAVSVQVDAAARGVSLSSTIPNRPGRKPENLYDEAYEKKVQEHLSLSKAFEWYWVKAKEANPNLNDHQKENEYQNFKSAMYRRQKKPER